MSLKQIILSAALVSSTSCYYGHLAKGQLDLRFNQVPIERAIKDEQNSSVRDLLSEVPDIKSFSEEFIGLDKSDIYSGYYRTDKEGVSFIVTASKKDKLEPYVWGYPIIGKAPYKSFFDKKQALDLSEELKSEGYDPFIFPATAYSTLGWFKDPVVTPMLQGSLYDLAWVVIHELPHGTMFVNNDVEFNEQLASFVGDKGAEQYLKLSGRYTGKLAEDIAVAKEKNHRFEEVVSKYTRQLESLYACESCDVLSWREDIFDDLEEDVKQIYPGRNIEFNNARLLNYTRYSSDSDYLNRLWDESGGEWKKFWVLVRDYAALKRFK